MEKTKYIVIVIDGAADYRIAELGDKTPLEAADKPVMDYLAMHGEMGMVKTIPDGMSPGSDIANLSILGYDPRIYHSGRSFLEAISMGVKLSDTDVTFRCNLVTLSDEENFEDKIMIDYCSGEITTEEARILIKDLAKALDTENIRFYPGVSYRHLIIWKNGPDEFKLTPAHDISAKRIGDYMPGGEYSDTIVDLMKKSIGILKGHPVNKKRIAAGKNPANAIWIWGKGNKPNLDIFYKKYGVNGSAISAVDLVKGIAITAGLKSVDVEGATGNIHTNFSGKAKAVIDEVKDGKDFVFIHIEAPDECGHQGDVLKKVKAIEIIDKQVVGYIKDSLDKMDVNYRILLLPDHPTPILKMTHTSEPVPFLIYDKSSETKRMDDSNPDDHRYDEFNGQKTGLYIEEGHKLLDYFFKK